MASRTVIALSGLAVPVAAIVCWQAFEAAGLLDYEYLPSPRDVLRALVELVRSGELAGDLAHTLGVAALAAALAWPSAQHWVSPSDSYPPCGAM